MYGTITSLLLSKDNKGRRFALVNFEDFNSAAKAVEELHGKDIRSEEEKMTDSNKVSSPNSFLLVC